MKMYKLNEIFLSIQGEGARVGTVAVFVRFAGCNLKCRKSSIGFDCDTDLSTKLTLSGQGIVDLCEELWGIRPGQRWVIFTGGEPALQLDEDLLGLFSPPRWKFAVETNGTLPLPKGLDWVTCSPKPNTVIVLPYVNEAKLVISEDSQMKAMVDGPFEDCLFVSPAFNGMKKMQKAVDICVEGVLRDPRWRLTAQFHKLLGIK